MRNPCHLCKSGRNGGILSARDFQISAYPMCSCCRVANFHGLDSRARAEVLRAYGEASTPVDTSRTTLMVHSIICVNLMTESLDALFCQ